MLLVSFIRSMEERGVVTGLKASRYMESTSTSCHHCELPPHAKSSPNSDRATATFAHSFT